MSGTNSANDFSVGNDVRIVLILGVLGRTDFKHIVGFQADPITKEVRVDRLDGTPLAVYLPGGWKGSFTIDRANSTADDVWATIEAMYWNHQRIPRGTLYEYIDEPDGSTSTYQFSDVAVALQAAGAVHQEAAIKQTVEFFAGQRRRI